VENQLEILSLVRNAAKKKVLFLTHAVRQMSRIDRMIIAFEVWQVIEKGELIEDYPEDVRGHSCLHLGHGDNNRPIHIVCSPKEDYLSVITAYLPDPGQWEDNFRKRRE
jgi:ABC-type cobalamin/Fe3+-siderophores transport system ATPase subunit